MKRPEATDAQIEAAATVSVKAGSVTAVTFAALSMQDVAGALAAYAMCRQLCLGMRAPRSGALNKILDKIDEIQDREIAAMGTDWKKP